MTRHVRGSVRATAPRSSFRHIRKFPVPRKASQADTGNSQHKAISIFGVKNFFVHIGGKVQGEDNF
jgi:hypothetical protein